MPRTSDFSRSASHGTSLFERHRFSCPEKILWSLLALPVWVRVRHWIRRESAFSVFFRKADLAHATHCIKIPDRVDCSKQVARKTLENLRSRGKLRTRTVSDTL